MECTLGNSAKRNLYWSGDQGNQRALRASHQARTAVSGVHIIAMRMQNLCNSIQSSTRIAGCSEVRKPHGNIREATVIEGP